MQRILLMDHTTQKYMIWEYIKHKIRFQCCNFPRFLLINFCQIYILDLNLLFDSLFLLLFSIRSAPVAC